MFPAPLVGFVLLARRIYSRAIVGISPTDFVTHILSPPRRGRGTPSTRRRPFSPRDRGHITHRFRHPHSFPAQTRTRHPINPPTTILPARSWAHHPPISSPTFFPRPDADEAPHQPGDDHSPRAIVGTSPSSVVNEHCSRSDSATTVPTLSANSKESHRKITVADVSIGIGKMPALNRERSVFE